MRYRLLGASGLRVSDLALGTMTFSRTASRRGARPSPGADWSWCATERDAAAMFERYLERGGNFIDTADIYAGGTAEALVGALIAPYRDRIVLATKFGLRAGGDDVGAGGSSYRTMVRSVDASLRQLATDHIDLLYLHAWDGITPLDEIARGFDALISSGKVLYAGVSDTPAWAVAALHARTPIAAVQLRYSLRDRAAELELLPMAGHLGIGVVAFGVLAGGLLGLGHSARQAARPLNESDTRAQVLLRELATATDRSPLQLAVGWVRSRSPLVPIAGARTAGQLQGWLDALDQVLTPTEIDALDAIAPPPALFPHDVGNTLRELLQGGPKHSELTLPTNRAF